MAIAAARPCAYCGSNEHQTYACEQGMPMVQPTQFESHYRPRWGEVVGLARTMEDTLRYDHSRALAQYDEQFAKVAKGINEVVEANNNLADAMETANQAFERLAATVESRTWKGRLRRLWAFLRGKTNPYRCHHGLDTVEGVLVGCWRPPHTDATRHEGAAGGFVYKWGGTPWEASSRKPA
jgi:hypothetical protein